MPRSLSAVHITPAAPTGHLETPNSLTPLANTAGSNMAGYQ
jgi:hypothetical protein